MLAVFISKVESQSTDLTLKFLGLEQLSLCYLIYPRIERIKRSNLLTKGVKIVKVWQLIWSLCLLTNEVTDWEAKLFIERVKRL